MNQRILVGTRKGLFVLGRRGRGAVPWDIVDQQFLGAPVTMVLGAAGGERLFAALDHGHFGSKLHRSDDAGRSWPEIEAPRYPAKPADLDERDPFSGNPIPWSLKRIWALESVAPHDGAALWCGTLPGGLFRSDDAGASWSLVEALWRHPKRPEWTGGGAEYPGIHSILVDPRDPAHVTVGVSVGGVWATFDGGGDWELRANGMRAAYLPPERAGEPNLQDPHRLVQCPAEPDRLWAQHHNGVFRSDDGGASWRELDTPRPSVFGFAAAVHPRDAQTAWFVPAAKDEQRIAVDAKLVVARTRDGGARFDVLDKGLPPHPAYDIVYRHALDVDGAGECLAFGSTTGGFWISEDQGDSWQGLAARLPPVYCVRFVG